jgi:ribosomal protein S18 acetylase RimI-like enzyme
VNVSQVEMPQGIVGQLRDKFRHRLVLQTLSRVLGCKGIEIVPYYVTQEFLKHETKPSVDPELGPVAACVLSPAEIEEVYTHPESKVMGGEETLLDERCLCFGLKVKGETAAYMWCNVQRCHSRLTRFPLKEDEAYLCSAVTFKAYRGKNLAPLLRYELYRYLNQMGRTNFYSITEVFNTPARKFKEKLGARHLRLGLHIGLFNRCDWNITLKRYRV